MQPTRAPRYLIEWLPDTSGTPGGPTNLGPSNTVTVPPSSTAPYPDGSQPPG